MTAKYVIQNKSQYWNLRHYLG